MPAKASSSTSGSSTRRHAGQTKSTRQQFSACGACRMRRVRCDLKDSPNHTGNCSNCKERGLKCVDEYGEVKSVKLLRRGRRLQQVEAVYGRDGSQVELAPPHVSPGSPPPPQSVIPQLTPDFLNSPFWRRFNLQRPVLDPTEFTTRFLAHAKGSTTALGPEGKLLASVLVIWAAAFGVDEYGNEDRSQDPLFNDRSRGRSESPLEGENSEDQPGNGERRVPDALWVKEIAERRRHRIETMLREALHLIDLRGVLRRPTWDGVRVLLLIMPLLENVQSPLDNLAFHDAAISQVHTLCTLAPPPSAALHSYATIHGTDEASLLRDEDGYLEALIKARIFWYAHLHEGLSTGLRGGRLTLTAEDLETFQEGLPSLTSFPYQTRPQSSGSSYPSPTSHPSHSSQPTSRAAQNYLSTAQLFALPLELEAVCRRVHDVLSGPAAKRYQARAQIGGNRPVVDEEEMSWIWEALEHCWENFESARQTSTAGLSSDDLARFVSSWQLAIFECYNVIRETLKGVSVGATPQTGLAFPPSPSSPGTSGFPPAAPPFMLHIRAVAKCQQILPRVLEIIQHELALGGGIFRWDAGLCRDGVFFAGLLAAGAEGTVLDGGLDAAETAMSLTLRALALMRFSFAQSEQREQNIRLTWESRIRPSSRAPHQQKVSQVRYHREPASHGVTQSPQASSSRRHILSPLRTTAEAPQQPWAAYTPPDSATTSSPDSYRHVFKEEELYMPEDLNQFSYQVPAVHGEYNNGSIPYSLSPEDQQQFSDYTYLVDPNAAPAVVPAYAQSEQEYGQQGFY